MTKKRSEILAVKMELFSEKNLIQKFWSVKRMSVPPNSAPGLRHCHCSHCNLVELRDAAEDRDLWRKLGLTMTIARALRVDSTRCA